MADTFLELLWEAAPDKVETCMGFGAQVHTVDSPDRGAGLQWRAVGSGVVLLGWGRVLGDRKKV